MIPTAILGGLIVGHWWAVPLIGLGMMLLEIFVGSCGGSCLVPAFLLACINAAVGVAIHLAIRAVARHYRGAGSAA